ncbi:MAG TPA: helix-turn-helix domain-containing protein, partial [Candidatus Limnocylindria bacterium]|nr:helix-turn-helix domain-containing protein [Candidatus Limnocylindria bacterium]
MIKNLVKDQERIGQFIAEVRELKGFTQSAFAKALKTSQSAVARMEKGQQNLTTEMLAKISGVLNHEIITLADKSINFKIQGGHKLSGKVSVNTSKNAAVALLCASLLNKGKTLFKNVPKIEEVYRVIEVLTSIGVSVKWLGSDVEITPGNISLNKIDKEAAVKTRSVLMLLGPLSHLLKNFSLPLSGGCKLGERTVRPHLFALEKLGVKIKTHHDHYEVSSTRISAGGGSASGGK